VSVTRKDHGRYLVEFTKGDMTKSFVTVPVLEKAELEKTFAEYDQLRIKRIGRLKTISDSLTSLRTRYEKEHEQTKDVNAGITKLVSEGKFLTALNDYMNLETAKLLTRSGSISRMAVINRFGIYNFDCAEMMWASMAMQDKIAQREREKKEKKTLAAHYYINNKRIETNIDDVFLIKRDFNGCFKLTRKEIFDFPAQEGSNADILVVVTNSKQLYYIKDEDFKALDLNAKDIAFNLKAAPADIKSPGKLRDFLNM